MSERKHPTDRAVDRALAEYKKLGHDAAQANPSPASAPEGRLLRKIKDIRKGLADNSGMIVEANCSEWDELIASLPSPSGQGTWPSVIERAIAFCDPDMSAPSDATGRSIAAELRALLAASPAGPEPGSQQSPQDALREAAEELVAACETDFCSPNTETGEARCDDEDAVAGNDSGECKVTFGMIRRLRAALSSAPGEESRKCDGCGTPLGSYCNSCQRAWES